MLRIALLKGIWPKGYSKKVELEVEYFQKIQSYYYNNVGDEIFVSYLCSKLNCERLLTLASNYLFH